MQLVLTILAGFGALLFIISYLAYVVSGFKHHFVTGVISTLPILNIITLPSLWYKSSRKFIIGLIGLIIFVSAWFFGADKGIKNLVSSQGGFDSSVLEEIVISNSGSVNSQQQPPNANTALISSSTIQPSRSHSFIEGDMQELPNKALYKMGFEVVPVNQIKTLQGRIVQIIKTDNAIEEGRIKSISPGSVILEGVFENELPIASIKQLKLMVKKANE